MEESSLLFFSSFVACFPYSLAPSDRQQRRRLIPYMREGYGRRRRNILCPKLLPRKKRRKKGVEKILLPPLSPPSHSSPLPFLSCLATALLSTPPTITINTSFCPLPPSSKQHINNKGMTPPSYPTPFPLPFSSAKNSP